MTDQKYLQPVEPEAFTGLEENNAYPSGYTPSDTEENYMNPQQLAFFEDMLLCWKMQLEEEAEASVKGLQENSAIEADLNDQATLETEQTLDLRTNDRARKLVNKINEALTKIEAGEFGFCEETGDPIGVARLLARPIATLCIEEKRRQEQQEGAYAG